MKKKKLYRKVREFITSFLFMAFLRVGNITREEYIFGVLRDNDHDFNHAMDAAYTFCKEWKTLKMACENLLDYCKRNTGNFQHKKFNDYIREIRFLVEPKEVQE